MRSEADPPVISFRPLVLADLGLLHEWLALPHVAAWWGPPPSATDVEHDRAPIGYIQSYVAKGSGDGWWPDEDDPGVLGIDHFLAHPEDIGRGLGTTIVRAFVQRLFADPEVTRVQADPSPQNRRAIRCFEKAGFRALREVDTPDGRALLMVCDRRERIGPCF